MDIFKDIPEEGVVTLPENTPVLDELLKLTQARAAPWRVDWLNQIQKNYMMKELVQWGDTDRSALDAYGVPNIAVDRINRGLDNINGIRENSESTQKVTKKELGDQRIADLLSIITDHVREDGEFSEPIDQAFDDLKDTGIGILKLAFDAPNRRITLAQVNPEDFVWSKAKRKSLEDIGWCYEHQTMDWGKAIAILPEHAGKLKSMRTVAASEWDELHKGSGQNVTARNKDYGEETNQGSAPYDDQVHIFDFWVERVIPFNVIQTEEMVNGVPTPNVQKVSLSDTPEQSQIVNSGVDTQWYQFIVASGDKNGKNGFLARVRPHQWPWHPFVMMIADRKKNGAPRGYIEIVTPHQVRINLAWAQKMAYNNKSIKSPLFVRNLKDISKAIVQSSIGAIFNLKGQEKVETVNVVPPLQLEAIEEGMSAREDMDFAAAATEAPLRGASGSSESGIKLSLKQDAAITPLNKWTKAERVAKKHLWKKALEMIISLYSHEEIVRIVGIQQFLELAGYMWDVESKTLVPMLEDPLTGEQIIPIEFPLDLSIAKYDVKIEDKSVSDYNKQMSFNAIEALVAGGVLLDEEYRIRNAPVHDVPAALASNKKAKMDRLRQLEMALNMLMEENDMLKKQVPSQQGAQGRAAPQAGRRSMVGGQTK